jgi:hypothetical protein
MNDNPRLREIYGREPTFDEKYGPHQKSLAWEDRESPPVFQARVGNSKEFIAFMFSSLLSAHCLDEQTVRLAWPAGTLVVRGPKAFEFFDAFCRHEATLLQQHGSDIVTVSFVPALPDPVWKEYISNKAAFKAEPKSDPVPIGEGH